MSRPSSRCRVWPRFALAVLALFTTTSSLLHAQPSAPVPIKKMFGVGDNEFFKGAWIKIKPGNETTPHDSIAMRMGELWNVSDWIKLNVLRYQMDETPDMINALASSSPSIQHRLITSTGMWPQTDEFDMSSIGREAIFYPFNTGGVPVDSVQFPKWKCRFADVDGGWTDSSSVERGIWDESAREQHFKNSGLVPTTSGTVIAQGVTFDWDSAQVDRWPNYQSGAIWKSKLMDTVMRTESIFGSNSWHISPGTYHYITVTGHLFDDNDTSHFSNVLMIELFHEIPGGSKYFTNTNVSDPSGFVTATSNIIRPLDTLYLIRDQLWPTTSSWNKYESASLPFDMRVTKWGVPGPLYSDARGSTESQRFDMKVTWLGKDVAIRSIAIRDSIGEMMLGHSASGSAFRAKALTIARYSYASNATDTVYRWPIIARVPHLEQYPVHMNAFNAVHRMMRDSISGYDEINQDTGHLPAWTEVSFNREMHTRFDDSNSNSTVVVAEMGLRSTTWLLELWGKDSTHPYGKFPHAGRA